MNKKKSKLCDSLEKVLESIKNGSAELVTVKFPDTEFKPKLTEVPENISQDNAFKDTYKLTTSYAKVLFQPTDNNLYDQCFNLDMTIKGFLLPRMIHLRDNCMGSPNGISFRAYEKMLNKIVRGLWIDLNITIYDRTKEQIEEVKIGRKLFYKWFDSFWF